jgi:predicted HTH transcriptional regulator
VPSGSWVVLKRAYGWVDRKFLNWPHTAAPDPGVEAIADARTQLEALVLSGEGPQIEFKIELPSASREARRKVARTVAAFANGEGGSILFGVRNEDGVVIGLLAADVTQAAEDAVTNFVRSLVTPLPNYTLERYDIDDQPGRIVLVLNIERGATPPYGVDPANPRYYVRRGGTTFPASADEVRTLARSRPSAEHPGTYSFGSFQR